MNFLSNLKEQFTAGLGTLQEKAGSFLSGLGSALNKGGLGAISSFKKPFEYNPPPKLEVQSQNFPIGANMSPLDKKIAENLIRGGNPQRYSNLLEPDVLEFNAQTGQTTPIKTINYRPATTVNPNQYSQPIGPQNKSTSSVQQQASQTQQPQQSFLGSAAGKVLPPPPQGASGISGQVAGQLGGAGGSAVIPQMGAAGIPGGGSAFNSLGGASLAGANSLLTLNQEEEKQKENLNKILLASKTSNKPFNVPIINGNIDMDTLIKQGSDIITKFKGGILDNTTKQQFIDAANQAITQGTERINQLKALPEEPMFDKAQLVDTPEQDNILNQTPAQIYEDLQRELGIPDLIKKYELNLSQVQAATDTFNGIIRDIQENPNLPKGLALARMREANNVAQQTIGALQGQAEILRTQLGFKQDELKSRLGLSIEAQETGRKQKEQEKDDMKQQINLLISTGALGDLSAQELMNIAKQSGYTPESLGKMAQAVKSGNETKIAKAQADLEKTLQTAQLAQEKLKLEQEKLEIKSNNQNLVQAILTNPEAYNTLTPSAKTQILPDLINQGFNIPIKLSPAQKEDISTMATVSTLIENLLNLGSETNWAGTGGFKTGSIKQFFASNLGIGSAEGEQIRNLIGNIKGTIAKLRGGTSFTENEERLLNTYVPTINDSPLVLENKLTQLKKFINVKNENIFNISASSTITGQDVNKEKLREKYKY